MLCVTSRSLPFIQAPLWCVTWRPGRNRTVYAGRRQIWSRTAAHWGSQGMAPFLKSCWWSPGLLCCGEGRLVQREGMGRKDELGYRFGCSFTKRESTIRCHWCDRSVIWEDSNVNHNDINRLFAGYQIKAPWTHIYSFLTHLSDLPQVPAPHLAWAG